MEDNQIEIYLNKIRKYGMTDDDLQKLMSLEHVSYGDACIIYKAYIENIRGSLAIARNALDIIASGMEDINTSITIAQQALEETSVRDWTHQRD